MSRLPVLRTVREAISFPIKSARTLLRRLGIAAIVSLVGMVIVTFAQATGGEAPTEAGGASNWPFWIGAILLTVGSLMITNGAIQIRLSSALSSKIWSLSNRELNQFAVGIFWIIIVVVVGTLLAILYWFVAMVLSVSFDIQSGDFESGHFGVLALVSGSIGLFFAVRLCLLPAYIADLNQFAAEASWKATKGYSWQIALTLVLIAVFYAVLWMLGALVTGITAAVIFEDATNTDAGSSWVATYLDLFVWPFTLYGHIAVCAVLGSIYKQLVQNTEGVIETDQDTVQS